MTDISPPPDTEAIWTRVRASFVRAVAAVGGAAAIAAITLMTRKLRRDIIAWLIPLEHVVRKLLLAEAAEIHRAEQEAAKRKPRIEYIPLRGMAMHWRRGTANFQARAGANIAGGGEPDLSTESQGAKAEGTKRDTSRPETWRARFSLGLPRDPHVVPESRAPRIRDPWSSAPPPPSPPERAPRVLKPEDSPFRLARRFEALRRVLDNPRPHAERLARILAREVRRWRQVVQRYWWAACRTNAVDPADPRLGLDALAAAFNAQWGFALDSS